MNTVPPDDPVEQARILCGQGRFEDAALLLRHVLTESDPVPGAEHPDTLCVRHSLANTLRALGQPEAAEAEHRAG